MSKPELFSRLVPAVQGDVGDDIKWARTVLNVWPPSNVLDAPMVQAVRGLQQSFDLPVTGEIDLATFEIIQHIGDRRAGLAR